jgi:hypothetical protein
MPVVTAASTPETPSALAGMNDAYPLNSEIVMLVWVSSVRADLRDQPSDRQPDGDSTRCALKELQSRVGHRETSGHDGRDRDLVRDQRRCVVEQALGLHRAHQAPWKLESAHDARACERVGRRDDGSERERRRPREPRDERVRDHCDRHHRREHEPDGAERHCSQVRADVAQVREERGPVEERRQEHDEHDVRIEADRRHPRHESEQRPAEDEHDRIGDGHPARQRAQARDRDQQPRNQDLRFVHSASVCPTIGRCDRPSLDAV